MKKALILSAVCFSLVFIVGCVDTKKQTVNPEMDRFIDNLIEQMTIDEKIGQLNLSTAGDMVTGEATSSNVGQKIMEGKIGAMLNVRSVQKIREVQRIAVEESRLKIPLIFGLDVIHGFQTIFPIPLGLASSFDMELVERCARIAATEATADGICWNFSPMADIARDPRWGRIAEGAGEDAYLGSRVAEALVRGYQSNDLAANNTMMACVKHFALYGAAEAGRDYNTTDMSRLRMYNEYLPPYLAAVKAGVGSVMTAFNEVDGIPASGNKWLMNDLLRDQWGFDGFVVTDFTAINEMIDHGMGDLQTVSALALNAGVDLDMVGEGFLTTLKRSLDKGKVTEEQIDKACRRILEAKYKLGLFDDPYRYCDENRSKTEIFTEEHNRVARETATKTFVLLKNKENLLPLAKKGKIALIGPLADNRENMAGTWSCAVDHNQSISVLEGFRNAVGDLAMIHYAKGSNIVDDPDLDSWVGVRRKPSIDQNRTPEQLRNEAVKLASKCDVILAVMGEAAEMSGESSSRTDLSLPGSQKQLLEELLKTGKPVVLVLFTGRPLTITWENENIPAILNVWFGGTQAGNAIADVIFGEANPSGKLPVTWPQNVGQIPIFYNHKNTGRPLVKGDWFHKFRSNYLDVSNDPLYPFGYGLSYTTFGYSDISLSDTLIGMNEQLEASVTVTNTGQKFGEEVVQLYTRQMVGTTTRPVKELKGFQKVSLNPGDSKKISFTIGIDDLSYYNSEGVKIFEPGEFRLFVGTNSEELKERKFWVLEQKVLF
jgi:beta-glucosidase